MEECKECNEVYQDDDFRLCDRCNDIICFKCHTDGGGICFECLEEEFKDQFTIQRKESVIIVKVEKIEAYKWVCPLCECVNIDEELYKHKDGMVAVCNYCRSEEFVDEE